MFDLIAFDADDTLWENNALYIAMRERVKRIVARYTDADLMDEQFDEIEVRNLRYYGYGVLSFILSCIEAAIQLSGGRILAADIAEIVGLAKEMFATPLRLYEDAEPTLRQLAQRYSLILITKGDLNHQQTKVAQSGLRQFFRSVEVVPDKTRATYAAILEKLGCDPARFLMVGDSLRSDILPVLELGGHAVYVPNPDTWTHENEELPQGQGERFFQIESLGRLPALLESLPGASPEPE
jgi:putative hydrolase of the HAD superfamily